MCEQSFIDVLVGVLSLLLVVSECLAFHKSDCNGITHMLHQWWLSRGKCMEEPELAYV